MTLYDAQSEIQSIISELQSIESGVRTEFKGIGEHLCGDSISKVESLCSKIKIDLYNVDTSRVAE